MALYDQVFSIDDEGFQALLARAAELKQEQLKYAEMLESLQDELEFSEKRIEKAYRCNDFIIVDATSDFKHFMVSHSNYCHQRCCPFCEVINSRKLALELITTVDYLKPNYSFLFVTLTVANCKGNKLKKTIKKMNKAFGNMMRTVRFNFVKGYYRKLEVTYNKENDTYHPHFHCLFAVYKSYFRNRSAYLSQAELVERWTKAAKKVGLPVHDHLIADIRSMGKDHKDVLELAKYAAKPSDYLENKEVFKVLLDALAACRMYVFSGIMKMVHRKVKSGVIPLVSADTTKYDYTHSIFCGYHRRSKNFRIMGITPKTAPIKPNGPPEEKPALIRQKLTDAMKDMDYQDAIERAAAAEYKKDLFNYAMNHKFVNTDKTFKDFRAARNGRVDFDYFYYATHEN